MEDALSQLERLAHDLGGGEEEEEEEEFVLHRRTKRQEQPDAYDDNRGVT